MNVPIFKLIPDVRNYAKVNKLNLFIKRMVVNFIEGNV